MFYFLPYKHIDDERQNSRMIIGLYEYTKVCAISGVSFTLSRHDIMPTKFKVIREKSKIVQQVGMFTYK